MHQTKPMTKLLLCAVASMTLTACSTTRTSAPDASLLQSFTCEALFRARPILLPKTLASLTPDELKSIERNAAYRRALECRQ